MAMLFDTLRQARRPDLLVRKVASNVIPCCKRFAYALLPTFLQHKLHPAATTEAGRLGDTAWMDGLRGLMAVLVMTYHQLQPYGRSPSIVFGGTRISFFVIGGYCGSHRAQKAMTAGAVPEAVAGIGKSAYRKCLRLYLPVFTTTFIVACLAYAGAFEHVRPWFDGNDPSGRYFVGNGWGPRLVARSDSALEQLRMWAYDSLAQTMVWQTGQYGWSPYRSEYGIFNSFLWTLREEFRASLALYLVLVMCSYMKPMVRMGALLVLSQFHARGGRWECMFFCWGAAVAQLDVSYFGPWRKAAEVAAAAAAQNAEEAKNGYLPLPCSSPTLSEKASPAPLAMPEHPPTTAPRVFAQLKLLARWSLWLSLLGLSCCLIAFPRHVQSKHPAIWHAAWAVTPTWWPKRSWSILAFGWALFIICMQTARSTSILHRLLTLSVPRYIGRLFFGILSTQLIVFCLGGYWLHHLGWHLFGGGWRDSGSKFWIGWSFGWVCNTVLCLWAADVWTRELFGRTNRLAAWLESLMVMPPPPRAAAGRT